VVVPSRVCGWPLPNDYWQAAGGTGAKLFGS
jgi:hypothetical protein